MVGALIFVSTACGQSGIAPKSVPIGRAARGGSFRIGRRGEARPARPAHPNFRGPGNSWGGRPAWGYLPYPDYYDDPYYEPSMINQQPEGIAAPYGPAAPLEREIHPILIERQGDQWVQVTGYPQSTSHMQLASPKAAESTQLPACMPGGSEVAEPPRELPPAVLVFRDGHKEEIKSYTIIGNTLYTSANYWKDGFWTRRIAIVNLNVPATLKVNQERGSEFNLPSGPQEVMIRM